MKRNILLLKFVGLGMGVYDPDVWAAHRPCHIYSMEFDCQLPISPMLCHFLITSLDWPKPFLNFEKIILSLDVLI